MRSFKASIARRVAEYFVWQVIYFVESESELELDVRMSVLKPLVLQWVAAAVGDISNRPDIFFWAWKEIVVNDYVISTVVYASACANHAQGTLFRYNTRGVIPEELPEEWESECQPGVDDDIADDVDDDVLLQVDSEHEGSYDVDDGFLQDEELAPFRPAAEFARTTLVPVTEL